jgi:uncharacterized protein
MTVMGARSTPENDEAAPAERVEEELEPTSVATTNEGGEPSADATHDEQDEPEASQAAEGQDEPDPPAAVETQDHPDSSTAAHDPSVGPAEDGASEYEAARTWNLVDVSDVVMNLPSAYPEIVLRESEQPHRELRIPVGLAEGTAIAHAWKGVSTPRPLTHEVVCNLLTMHNVSIACIRITERRGRILFAELDTTSPRGRRIVPCRPSDAIALALRQPLPTPMLVSEHVLAGREESHS